MQDLSYWLVGNRGILALLVTVGVAVLLVYCIECTRCPKREKDDIFRRHEF